MMAILRRNRHTAQALTASASTVDLSSRAQGEAHRKSQQDWQQRAWGYYDEIPEIWFAHNYVANALRRVRIFPALQPDPSQPPVPLDPAVHGSLAVRAFMEIDRLRGEDGTHGDLLHDIAMQLSIPGEGYLVGDIDPNNGEEEFGFFSSDELKYKDGRWSIVESLTDQVGKPLTENALVNRIWRPHPRWRSRPDSSMRAVIDACEELQVFTRWARSTGRSRLNAGALFLPDSISMQPLSPGSTQWGENVDPFLSSLMTAMITPIQEEGSASAVVPAVFKVKGELIEQIRHMVFERPFDTVAQDHVDKVLRRIASGIDLPSEVILGMADLNHWTAWQVDSSTFKAHLEPLLTLVVSGLTKAFMTPAMGDVSGQQVIVWFDPSALVTNPNQGEDADKAFDRYALSWDAYRRYKGFTEADAPEDDEIQRRIDINKAKAPAAPGAAAPGAASGDAPSIDNSAVVASASSNPSARQRAERFTAIDASLRRRLQVAMQATIAHAVDSAGSKLRVQVGNHSVFGPMVSQVSNRDLCFTLGQEVVSSYFNTNDLLDEGIISIIPIYLRMISSAQAEVRAELAELANWELEALALEARQETSRVAGEVVLRSTMTKLLEQQLFAPHLVEPGIPEALRSNVTVPTSAVRQVIAVAGGDVSAPPVVGGRGAIAAPDAPDATPASGIASGADTREAMSSMGFVRTGWVWTYGDSDRPFPAHLELSGSEFEMWTSDTLAVQPDDIWIGDYYYPGDHNGCQCDTAELFEPATTTTNDDQSSDLGADA